MLLTSQNLNFSFNLPGTLTDTTGKIWFYNNADWQNYWKNITANFRLAIPSVVVPDYIYSSFSFSHNNVTINATPYDLASLADLVTLKTKIDTLVTSIITLRQRLITAGWLIQGTGPSTVLGIETLGDILGSELGQEIGIEQSPTTGTT